MRSPWDRPRVAAARWACGRSMQRTQNLRRQPHGDHRSERSLGTFDVLPRGVITEHHLLRRRRDAWHDQLTPRDRASHRVQRAQLRRPRLPRLDQRRDPGRRDDWPAGLVSRQRYEVGKGLKTSTVPARVLQPLLAHALPAHQAPPTRKSVMSASPSQPRTTRRSAPRSRRTRSATGPSATLTG